MKVITLSREYGAGGHSIGREVAKQLGIEFYDRDIINEAAKKSGIGNQEDTTQIQAVNASSIEDTLLLADEEKTSDANDNSDTEETNEKEPEEETVYDPWIDERLDFNALAESASDETIKNMYMYFANREPSYKNEYTGMFEGYNLIYICAEGYWS